MTEVRRFTLEQMTLLGLKLYSSSQDAFEHRVEVLQNLVD